MEHNGSSENFSREIFFAMNSLPVQFLEENFIPEIAKELRQQKEFMRRDNCLGKLVGGDIGLLASDHKSRN